MWASSHMGPRGFRVSLAQTAAKGDYRIYSPISRAIFTQSQAKFR